MTHELLPCPFCGSPCELERATDTWEEHHGRRAWWGVVCRGTTNLGGSCAIQQRPSASPEAAVTRWNTRTYRGAENVSSEIAASIKTDAPRVTYSETASIGKPPKKRP